MEPLKLATLDQSNLDKTYELAGYPYNENISLESQGMYGAKGRLHSMTGRRTVLHTIDSSSGQSGAPLLNENNQVEAIHTFAKASEQLNGGVAIDSYIYAYVASYAAIDEPVYRLYNPNSGEHLYTTEYNELVNCVKLRLERRRRRLAFRKERRTAVLVSTTRTRATITTRSIPLSVPHSWKWAGQPKASPAIRPQVKTIGRYTVCTTRTRLPDRTISRLTQQNATVL